ncbi:MAG TPA: phage tail protein [Blastocatellia bacterium]|nr:phage tail protein [Blastocatellia bacterium]
MDANGLRFWMLAKETDWQMPAKGGAVYDTTRNVLCLPSERASLPALPNVPVAELEAHARARVQAVPMARDEYGNRAWWSADQQRIFAAGVFADPIAIWQTSAGKITDFALGYDGTMYIVVEDGSIVMQDRRDRWEPVTVRLEGFTAWRIAAHPDGGVWALDREHHQLARLTGTPLPKRPLGTYTADTFRPCEENPAPPRLVRCETAHWFAAATPEVAVGLACHPQGRLALLTWTPENQGRVRCLNEDGTLTPGLDLAGAVWPYSLTWVSENRLAVLLPKLEQEALVYALPQTYSSSETRLLKPVGDVYPLRDFRPGPFAHTLSEPPHYPIQARSRTTPDSAPLHHLSLPNYAHTGEATNSVRRVMDSGNPQTVWHRLYLEASIPANCGVKVFLAANDERVAPKNAEPWYEHRFGALFALTTEKTIPRGAWVNAASELPYHPGLLSCPREKDRTGLFTVLIQRAGRQVRNLQGRFLHMRVELVSDGQATPEVAAVRAYGSRFSYVDRYLPELFRETAFGADANERAEVSTPSDFLERFLNNCEGLLTPLEDRIANAWLVTDPRTAPAEALEWLGSWIGVAFHAAYPAERRRLWLENAAEVFRQRGTLGGLRLALDLATGGAVTGGEIIVIENFRLRRTFATILGADLADEEDPLLAGLAISGNSFVGDTLFLGNEQQQEFLALFAANLSVKATEAKAIQDFFDAFAHRVTVLVHQEFDPQNLGLIRRIVELEKPAHVEAQVLPTAWPLLVSVASLVGVDTYLANKPKPQAVRIGTTRLGRRDFVQSPASLDPRLERGRAPLAARPIARLKAPAEVEFGKSFRLDGSDSEAPPGHQLTRFFWRLRESP